MLLWLLGQALHFIDDIIVGVVSGLTVIIAMGFWCDFAERRRLRESRQNP